jgi:hypothetical protein
MAVSKPATVWFEEVAVPTAGVAAVQALRGAGPLRAGETASINTPSRQDCGRGVEETPHTTVRRSEAEITDEPHPNERTRPDEWSKVMSLTNHPLILSSGLRLIVFDVGVYRVDRLQSGDRSRKDLHQTL